jgi:hypothetical protein
MWATVEYRKNGTGVDSTKLRWPTNDDIADSRGLKYKADVIVHVYNDINDRKEHAEIFWTNPMEPEKKLPRLALDVSKNKISSSKDKLALDLDPLTTTLKQLTIRQAMRETQGADQVQLPFQPARITNKGIEVDTDYEEDDDDTTT